MVSSRQSDGATPLSGIFGHSNSGLGIAARDHITFLTGGTSLVNDTEEALRIDSTGKVLIGVDASTSSNSYLQVFKKTGNDSTIVVGNVATSASGLCRYDFCPSNSVVGARIECHATEDFSTTANRTADLVFVTRKDGTHAEKLRIDSDGRLLQNGITAVDDYMHQMEGAGGTGKVPAILLRMEQHQLMKYRWLDGI